MFACPCVLELPDGDEFEEPEEGDYAAYDGDEDFPAVDTRPREAVMLGAPYEGGGMVFITTGADGNPVALRTAGPVRLPRTG